MPITQVQRAEIQRDIEQINAKIKNLNTSQSKELVEKIKALLEENAELYNQVKKISLPVRTGANSYVASVSPTAFATNAIILCNIFYVSFLNKTENFASPYIKDMDETTAFYASTFINYGLPALEAMTSFGIYKMIRQDREESMPALAKVTRVDMDGFFNSHKKMSLDALMQLHQLFEKENSLLKQCMASQDKDTLISSLGAAASTFLSTAARTYVGAFFKPLFSDVVVRGVTGFRFEYMQNVNKLVNAFPEQTPRPRQS